jgi:hypothetical protein
MNACILPYKGRDLTRALCALTCSVLLPGFAQVVTRSGTVNGISAEVGFDGPRLRSDEMIRYCFLTTNSSGATIFYPKREYFVVATLRDELGTNLPLRGHGLALGTRFSELTSFSPDKIQTKARRGSDPSGPMVDHLRVGGCEARELYTPDDLFKITHAGLYVLQLQFQVFELKKLGTNLTYTVVTLPPMKIPVVKNSTSNNK